MSNSSFSLRDAARCIGAAAFVATLFTGVGQAQAEREILGIRVGADEIVLQSSGRIASVTAAPVEQERTVLLILGHRPAAGLTPPAAPEGGLIRDVELRTETGGSSVFTKVLVATSSAVRAVIETSGAEARIRFEPTDAPVLLPPKDDLFIEEPRRESPSNAGARLRTVAPVYLREGPGQRYGAVTVVDADQNAELLGREGAWSWIRIDGGPEGWVHEDFVTAGGPMPLQIPSEVGTRSVAETARPASTTPPATAAPEAAPPSSGGSTISERVEALLGAFESERGELQDQLTQALQEADSLRSVRFGLERQLRDVTEARDRLRARVRELENRERGDTDRLFAVESELDAKRLELGALRAQQQTEEQRLTSLVERAENALAAQPEPSEDLVERLTRVLAVLELQPDPADSRTSPSAGSSRSLAGTPRATVPPATPSSRSEAGSALFTVPPQVERWALAWQEQDVEAYLAHYSPSFRPAGGKSLQEWQALRRQRLSAPASITIEITELEVDKRTDTAAAASFFQRYESDQFSDRVRKRLELELEEGAWKIVREVSLPPE
ncbi:MAG: SH3 domain-containing protein [Acidobacteriota bacterium]